MCFCMYFSTKALHLEIITDLSTSAFLNALKRFIARRGKCYSIHSDNGTNFVGANNALKEMYKLVNASDEKIHHYKAEQSIRWYFLPPPVASYGRSVGVSRQGVQKSLNKGHWFDLFKL